MILPTEALLLLYAKNLTKLEIEVTKNDKLLDKITELVSDNKHYKRQNTILSKLVIDKDKQIEAMSETIDTQQTTIHNTQIELQTQSIELQKALAAYQSHA